MEKMNTKVAGASDHNGVTVDLAVVMYTDRDLARPAVLLPGEPWQCVNALRKSGGEWYLSRTSVGGTVTLPRGTRPTVEALISAYNAQAEARAAACPELPFIGNDRLRMPTVTEWSPEQRLLEEAAAEIAHEKMVAALY